MVGLIVRRAQEGRHAVADIFVDDAVLGFDTSVHQGEMRVQQIGSLGGQHFFGHRRKAGDVGEHQGDLVFFRRDDPCPFRTHDA